MQAFNMIVAMAKTNILVGNVLFIFFIFLSISLGEKQLLYTTF